MIIVGIQDKPLSKYIKRQCVMNLHKKADSCRKFLELDLYYFTESLLTLTDHT